MGSLLSIARRCSLPSNALAIFSLAAWVALPLLGPVGPWWLPAPVATMLLGLILALGRAAPAARSLALLTVLLCVALATRLLWQPVMLIVLLAFWWIGRKWPNLAATPDAYRRGSVPPFATLGVGLVTPGALLLWWRWAEPDLADVVSAYVPPVSWPLLVAGGLGFALCNATLEELLFRGLLQDRLGALWGSGARTVVVQAVVFGICHAHGVPRGGWGVLMAGTWALMLGALRLKTGGLLAPVLGHVIADASIAGIVISIARLG
jgi:membrane protease YdiL (CAAX protease family)